MRPGQFGPISRAPCSRTNGMHRRHVEHRDALGDADDEADAGVGRFDDARRRRTSAARRSTDGVGAGRAHRLGHGVEDRHRALELSGRPCPASRRPTTWVPYSIICCAWNEPSRPVMPCTTSRVSLVDEDAHAASLARAATACCTASSMSLERRHADALQDLERLLLVGAGEADDDRHLDRELRWSRSRCRWPRRRCA